MKYRGLWTNQIRGNCNYDDYDDYDDFIYYDIIFIFLGLFQNTIAGMIRKVLRFGLNLIADMSDCVL